MAKKTSGNGKNGGNMRKKQAPAKSNAKSKKNAHWVGRIISVGLIGAILFLSVLFFEDNINAWLRLKGYIQEDYSGMSTGEAVGEGVVTLGNNLNIHFVDVGQGDACIIELPDDRTMIIDGGDQKKENNEKLLTYIEQNIKDEADKTIARFDIAILTHSDSDHCGGLDDVLLQYPADTFYRPNQEAVYKGYQDPGLALLRGTTRQKDTLAYMRAIDAGHKSAQTVFVTDARNDAQNVIKPSLPKNSRNYYEINFYTPTKDHYTDVNDYSPIIILEYEGKRIALSGDAEKAAEAEFVALAEQGQGRYAVFTESFSVDLIKLGHHGSKTSSSENYLGVITSAANRQNVIIVISCGAGNHYGHPNPEVLTRLKNMGFSEENILRTDSNGNIAMSVRADSGGQFQLYHGAEMVRTLEEKPLTYRDIALIVFVALAMVVLIQPFVSAYITKHKKNGTNGKPGKRA